jgi:hypothetical protein
VFAIMHDLKILGNAETKRLGAWTTYYHARAYIARLIGPVLCDSTERDMRCKNDMMNGEASRVYV